MPDLQEWKGYLSGYRGKLVVWIDQSSDERLLAENRGGVCFAIVDQWITAYTSNQQERSDFVNSFRQDGLPEELIDRQAFQRESVQVHNALLESAKMLQSMGMSGLKLKGVVEQVKSSAKDLHAGTVTKYPPGSALPPILVSIGRTPGYTRLSFRPASGETGHVVGFEVRPDLAAQMVGSSYPEGLFEFLDANLGLFIFHSGRTLTEFFYLEVWKRLYEARYAGCTFVVEHQTVAPGTGLGEAEDDPDLLAELMRLEGQEKHAASSSSSSSGSNTNTNT